MTIDELVGEIRARCPNNYLLSKSECEKLIKDFSKPVRVPKTAITDSQISEIITILDTVMLDYGLEDEAEDLLNEAVEKLEALKT
jgi:hypothetical protein